MALTFNPTLKTTLDGATSKLDWANKLQTALGNTRRLRCFHDANAQAADPSATGTEFLNVGSNGALTIVGGSITGFGTLRGMTIHTAMDLTSGSAVLRLEGNGNWVQGTLGLSGSSNDFVLSANLTSTAGVAVASSTAMKPPRLLPSGTGPVAPPIRSTTPTIVELVDWTNPAGPVVVGTATFSVRDDDMVFQHPSMASEIGDVAIYQLNSTIKWTSPPPNQRFELGGLLMIASNYNSQDGSVQLEQMLLSFKPLGRWASYPAMDTFVKTQYTDTYAGMSNPPGSGWPVGSDTENRNRFTGPNNPNTADITYPPPFKINLKSADGTIIYTHEMKAFNDMPAGPINGPAYSNVLSATQPLVPHFNCGQMLPWQNIRTKRSSNLANYYPGVNSYSYSGDRAKSGPSSNPDNLLINQGQIWAFNHLYVMPPYPLKNVTLTTGTTGDTTYLRTYESWPRDPDAFPSDSIRDHYACYRWSGYKYQPGSISGHDWRSGVGGMRFDRSCAPSVLSIWASNPNWVRPEGNVPIMDMVEGWGLAYFNHSNHWLRDVRTFDHLPKAEILAGQWVFANAYYGGGPYGALGQPMGPDKTIDLNGPYHDRFHWVIDLDPTGRLTWSGWQRDSLHSYCNAAWYTILLNSPMHAIAATHDFATQWMSSLGAAPANTDQINGGNVSPYSTPFMYREGAWRWLSYAMTWQVATNHRLTYSREDIEARFQVELETLYNQVYIPLKTPTHPQYNNVYFTTLRNLGHAPGDHGTYTSSNGGSLALYYVHCLVLIRQFGLWKAMSARSDKCAKMLNLMIELLDKACIDYVCDTDCRDAYYPIIVNKGSQNGVTGADIPANWAAQKSMLDTAYPVLAPGASTSNTQTCQQFADWTRKYDGRCDEQDGNPHMFRQYFAARATYFPEFPNARLATATQKMLNFYTTHDTAQTNGTAYNWAYYFPSHGEIAAPASLTPIA